MQPKQPLVVWMRGRGSKGLKSLRHGALWVSFLLVYNAESLGGQFCPPPHEGLQWGPARRQQIVLCGDRNTRACEFGLALWGVSSIQAQTKINQGGAALPSTVLILDPHPTGFGRWAPGWSVRRPLEQSPADRPSSISQPTLQPGVSPRPPSRASHGKVARLFINSHPRLSTVLAAVELR